MELRLGGCVEDQGRLGLVNMVVALYTRMALSFDRLFILCRGMPDATSALVVGHLCISVAGDEHDRGQVTEAMGLPRSQFVSRPYHLGKVGRISQNSWLTKPLDVSAECSSW